MRKKNLIKQKEENLSLNGENSFVQSNIDDFIKEDKLTENLDKEEAQNSTEIEGKSQEKGYKPLEGEEIKLEKVDVSPEEVERNLNLQKMKLDDVEQSVSKRSTKKSKILNIVFFFVNIAIVAGILTYQLLKQPLGESEIKTDSLDFKWLLVMVLLLTFVVMTESFAISYLLKQSTGKWKFGTSYKVAEIGRYYDAVTPMATGGQAFQVSYLKSRGVPVHTSLSVPLAKYVFGQIAWVIVSFVCLIISQVDKSYGTFVSITSIIGFVLGFIVLAATLFLSVCKTVGKKLVVKGLKLLHKMKIVKNYDKQYEKITKYISDYQDVMKQFAKSPKDFAIMTLLSIFKNLFNYSMPFFIAKFFAPGLEWSMFFRLFIMSVLVDLSSSFFPLPGGTGMNEISFSAAFAVVVSQEDILVWVLLLWRFCSYYFYLIQGVFILTYDMAYGNRKYKWQVRKNYLVEESAVFKQEQINRFKTARAKRRKSKV